MENSRKRKKKAKTNMILAKILKCLKDLKMRMMFLNKTIQESTTGVEVEVNKVI
jgi:hypothetical protein